MIKMGDRQTVIVFKSESDSSDVYAEELQRHNFQSIFVPTLSFGFKNLEALQRKLETPDRYAGMIFTSPRCVEAVREALETYQCQLHSGWKLLHNYAVGEVTHNLALNLLDQLFTHGKQTGNAGALADYILDTFDASKDLPFLVPCGNLALETLSLRLSAHGYQVETCEVYETKCHPNLAENMQKALSNKNIQYLCFFSPSGVNCVAEHMQKNNIDVNNAGWKLVAIGASSRRAMEQLGWQVHRTAAKPSVAYLVKALLNIDEETQITETKI